MESKVIRVFYGSDCLPYKDEARTVHFPIVGNAFQNANNTDEIRFYYDQIGGTDTTWIAITKLPNGKLGSKIVQSSYDSDLAENYVTLSLSSFYTQYKGDIFISLQGYQNGVEVEYDEDSGIYSISGTPTIRATGSIKLAVNYATGFIGSGEEENVTLQEIFGYLATKLDINASVVVLSTITNDISGYDIGQIFFAKTENAFYVKTENGYELYNGVGVLANGNVLARLNSVEYLSFDTLYSLFGSHIFIAHYEGIDYLVHIYEITSNTTYKASAYDLLNKYYYERTLSYDDDFSYLISSESEFQYVVKQSDSSTVYAIDDNENQVQVPYSSNVEEDTLVLRDENGQVLVPTTPVDDNNATSKEYVDNIDETLRDLIYTITKNAFINVDTTEYATVDDFLESEGEEGNIYLYPIDTADLSKGFYQYIWESINGTYQWQYLGTTLIDLSDYATTNYVDAQDDYVISLVDDLSETLDDYFDELERVSTILSLYGSYFISNHTLYVDTAEISDNVITLEGSVSNNTLTVTPSLSFYTKDEADDLLDEKVDKVSTTNIVYGTNSSGNQTTFAIDNGSNYIGNVVRRSSNSQIIVPLTPTDSSHATSKNYVDVFAKALVVTMNSSTYVITFELLDNNGSILSSQSIDLPLETMIVDGEYDSENKELILTLNNGNTIEIPIADLIDGLVSENDLATTLSNYYTQSEINEIIEEQDERIANLESDIESLSNEIDNLANLLSLTIDNFVAQNTLYNISGSVSSNELTIDGTISNNTLTLITSVITSSISGNTLVL